MYFMPLRHSYNNPHQVSNPAHHNYTIIGNTNAMSKPVVCAVIITGKTNIVLDTPGIDYTRMSISDGLTVLDRVNTMNKIPDEQLQTIF